MALAIANVSTYCLKVQEPMPAGDGPAGQGVWHIHEMNRISPQAELFLMIHAEMKALDPKYNAYNDNSNDNMQLRRKRLSN